MTLRNQINVRMLSIVVAILLMGGSMAIWKAKKSVVEEVSSSFHLVKTMLDFGFNKIPISLSLENEHVWEELTLKLQEARHVRIEVVGNGGTKHKILNHQSATKETPPSWFVYAIATDFPKLQHNIILSSNSLQSISISTDPNDELQEAWEEFLTFFWSIVAILSVLFLTINAVFNYMFKAVQNILFSLKEITSGQYERKLPRYNIDEFDDIASSINNLSSALKEAHENNKELTFHSLNIQEHERKTMAQELHDEMGQSLTAIKAMAVATKQQHDATTVASDTIIGICDHLSGIVSSRMRNLHPLSLTDLGLGDTLKNLITEWGKNHPQIKVRFSYTSSLDKLDHEKSIHLYRIVQESLTNISKHSSATDVEIKLELLNQVSQASLSIKDNGSGFEIENNQQGFGLRGMKERAESLGGFFSINSSNAQGVCITTLIPAYG